MYGVNFCDSSDGLFEEGKFLKINDIYKLFSMIFIHKVFINKNGQYNDFSAHIYNIQVSHSYNTRTTDVRLPSIRIDREKQSVIYQGLKLWNIASDLLKSLNCTKTLKRVYKAYLLSEY